MTQKQRLLLLFILLAVAVVLFIRFIGNFLLVLLILSGFLAWFVHQYNHLQSLSQQVREGHSNIMVSMKKRVDLANKLVDIASNYGDHEKLTHISIAKAESLQSTFSHSSRQVETALSGVMVMARAYPELRANEAYQKLMHQLETIESDLQTKRQDYNAKVRVYNTRCNTIPIVFFASQLGFRSAAYFDVENSDSLENLKDFVTDDGTLLKAMLSGVGNRVMSASQSLVHELNTSKNKLPGAEQEDHANQSSTTSSTGIDPTSNGSLKHKPQ